VEKGRIVQKAKKLIGIPSDAKAKSKWLMSRSRWALKTLVVVLTGHYGNRHSHLLGIGVPRLWNGGGDIISPIRSLPSLVVYQEALSWGLHNLLQGVFLGVGTDPCLRQGGGTFGWRGSWVVRWGGFEGKRRKGP